MNDSINEWIGSAMNELINNCTVHTPYFWQLNSQKILKLKKSGIFKNVPKIVLKNPKIFKKFSKNF